MVTEVLSYQKNLILQKALKPWAPGPIPCPSSGMFIKLLRESDLPIYCGIGVSDGGCVPPVIITADSRSSGMTCA